MASKAPRRRGEMTVGITISVPLSLAVALDAEATSRECSRAEVVTDAVRQYFHSGSENTQTGMSAVCSGVAPGEQIDEHAF